MDMVKQKRTHKRNKALTNPYAVGGKPSTWYNQHETMGLALTKDYDGHAGYDRLGAALLLRGQYEMFSKDLKETQPVSAIMPQPEPIAGVKVEGWFMRLLNKLAGR